MLAGCSSSTLLSPRHRLRSEASAQFQASHFQLPSMSTQRLDLPCNFPRKDNSSSRSQSLRPVGLPVEKKPVVVESKPKPPCSLKQNIRLPPLATTTKASNVQKNEFWGEKSKSLKRLAEQDDDSFTNRAKRTKVIISDTENPDVGTAGNFWFNSPSIPFSLTCSGEGEEERVCLVPSEVVSAPWVDSIVTKITDSGEKGVEGSNLPSKEASASNTSSDSQSLSLRLNENDSEQEVVGNGRSGNPYHHDGTEVGTRDEENQEEHRGFELVSLLTACVDAIGSRNVAAVNCFIAKLGDLASPRARTSISRVCAYFTEALAIRVTRIWPHIFHISTPRELDRVEEEAGTALRLLNQVSPIPKFLHFTSNEILLRAFEGKDRVHIIDFDIKQGLQWPSLFQSLAARTNPPSHVRITGIGESKQELNETGDRLAGFAQALNLPFEFHPVVDRLEDVRLWMLHVKEHESVAVNCISQLHKTLYDGSGGALRDFLGLIRSTNPAIVLVAEQEAEHNGLRLETRVCNSLKYYSALFDSIDHCLSQDSPVRNKIEEMYAWEIRNIIACEGRERVERHESFQKWRKMMEQGGFRNLGISEREVSQSRMLLKMYACENYNVKRKKEEEEEAITLSWLEQPLYTVSAWAPLDVAATGSQSSYSQP
ncbi:scarecrow-like protein 28 [Neltuma alba]|uniref:scarecrow-like protein 28 n=1 Tax=Neltuma alba TaxID=207710 RepID=UPI0010A3073C|nr:scarecrow-like protein 28 [Prosopis alba]XP_028800658.1 scarecrow-like protein 28 [Prosopis alba]XP_028800659.1 scarecrow-like protein 28 [Prosopis alba]